MYADVWLYTEDERQVQLLRVNVPLPRALTWNGEVYLWSTKLHGYKRVIPYDAALPSPAGAVADNREDGTLIEGDQSECVASHDKELHKLIEPRCTFAGFCEYG